MTIGLRINMPPRPGAVASYALRVPRAGGLPAASFRPRLAAAALAVRLTVPAIRVRRGLPPPSECALPGAHEKGAAAITATPLNFWRALRDSNPRPLDPKPEKWGHRGHPVTPNLLCYLPLTKRQFSDVCPVLGCFGVSTIQKLDRAGDLTSNKVAAPVTI